MSPRYYQSNETAGDGGDGLYEFRPRDTQSLPYSEYKGIQMSKGQHSGQFLIAYEQDEQKNENLTSNAKLTATIELSHMTEFLKIQVNLNDIPVSNKDKSEVQAKLS